MWGRIAWWIFLLQKFDNTVIHSLGKNHAIVDVLSKIENGEVVDGIEDDLPDANLFYMEE